MQNEIAAGQKSADKKFCVVKKFSDSHSIAGKILIPFFNFNYEICVEAALQQRQQQQQRKVS